MRSHVEPTRGGRCFGRLLAFVFAASLVFVASSLPSLGGLRAEDAPLEVSATIPDLGLLAKEVGGEDVNVTVFAKGVQDPHFMEAKPSFIKSLSRADLFAYVGLELETGWVPSLLENCRNARVLRGAEGYFNASTAITPKDLPAGIVDRTMGDVHPLGNPHYLLDPVNGLLVARALRDKLSGLRPARKEAFEARYAAFAKKLATSLLGEKLAAKYDGDKLVRLYERGGLPAFLAEEGERDLLGGWVKRLEKFQGTPFVGDHNLWPYFAERFGFKIVGFLEPKPGIAPTTRHLAQIIELIRAQKVPGILSVVYFDERHSRFVAEKSGAKVLPLAHQCQSRPGTDDYLSMAEYNVVQIEKALGGTK